MSYSSSLNQMISSHKRFQGRFLGVFFYYVIGLFILSIEAHV